MTAKDPRAALSALISALERHLDVAVATEGEDADRIDAATDHLAQAFETYDDALFDAYGVATPFVVFDEDEDDVDDYDEDFDDFDDLDDEDDDSDDDNEDDN